MSDGCGRERVPPPRLCLVGEHTSSLFSLPLSLFTSLSLCLSTCHLASRDQDERNPGAPFIKPRKQRHRAKQTHTQTHAHTSKPTNTHETASEPSRHHVKRLQGDMKRNTYLKPSKQRTGTRRRAHPVPPDIHRKDARRKELNRARNKARGYALSVRGAATTGTAVLSYQFATRAMPRPIELWYHHDHNHNWLVLGRRRQSTGMRVE